MNTTFQNDTQSDNKTKIRFIDLNEFCTITGWSKNTAYSYLKDLPIKKFKFGRFLRFDRVEVMEWVNNEINQSINK